MTKVFIDGKAGTTGLRIYERLGQRDDIELITLKEEDRKILEKRVEAINSSDITFLCLPDAASVEAVSNARKDVRIIDTSTAHRTNTDWAYGFPELSKDFYQKIYNSNRIAVPGCHASGFIALIYPLIKNKIISPDTDLSCTSISGYSGAGKKAIEIYEGEEKPDLWNAPREYAIAQQHKHLKEMKAITGIDKAPIFMPIIADYYSGMLVTVGLHKSQLLQGKNIDDIKEAYSSLYKGDIVKYVEKPDEEGFVSAKRMSGKDSMQIFVDGNEDRILLLARYDNLGKGASGAAIECMNLITDKELTFGLNI